MSGESALTNLEMDFAIIRSRLTQETGKADSANQRRQWSPRAEALRRCFKLSNFELDLLLLTAFTELEPDAARIVSQIQGDPRLQAPTVAMAFSRLEKAHWSALAPDGPLLKNQLLELSGEGPTTARTITISARILHYIVGLDTIDETLLLISRQLDAPDNLPASRQIFVEELVSRLEGNGSTTVPQLCGAARSDKIAIAATAGAKLGVPVFLMDTDNILATPPQERVLLACRWNREMVLADTLLVLDVSDSTPGAETRQIVSLVEALSGKVVLITEEPLALHGRTSLRLDVPLVEAAEQIRMWRQVLGPLGRDLDGSIERMADHFAISPMVMSAVGSELRRAREKNPKADLDKIAWAATRSQARPKLGSLAQRLDGKVDWSAIVLPDLQLNTLKTIAAQVRQRTRVYKQWGFEEQCKRGLGISALFSGGSGTGKTLAAEILGSSLELDVYRIDLSAVVSKWIGETEKNLRRIFEAAEQGCAVLLFDEADALFGKRTDVKDSHDRYANIEISYLLQRIETYRGLVILTTNMKNNIDNAFLRRIRFIVDFPFPEAEQRAQIWEKIFPKEAPVDGLAWDLLAQLSVTGGSIRNIALNAAFLAADEKKEKRVNMGHVLKAARTEYDKIGRSLTDHEVRGWQV